MDLISSPNDRQSCPKCGGPLITGIKRMYPDFCSKCADDIKKILYKQGSLSKLQNKTKRVR